MSKLDIPIKAGDADVFILLDTGILEGIGFDISAKISLIEFDGVTGTGGTGGGGLLGTIVISGKIVDDVVLIGAILVLLNAKSNMLSTGTGEGDFALPFAILIPPNISVTSVLAVVTDAADTAVELVVIPPNISVLTSSIMIEAVAVTPPEARRLVIPTVLFTLTPPNNAAAIFSFSVNSLGLDGSELAVTGVVDDEEPLLNTLPIPNGEAVEVVAT